MIKFLTCYFFAALNKVMDDEVAKLYEMGKYDFQAPAAFMVPLCSLYMLNLGSLVVGFWKIWKNGRIDEMVMQAFVPLFGVVLNLPLLEGLVVRKDKGRVSSSVSLVSAVVSSLVVAYATLA